MALSGSLTRTCDSCGQFKSNDIDGLRSSDGFVEVIVLGKAPMKFIDLCTNCAEGVGLYELVQKFYVKPVGKKSSSGAEVKG